MHFTEYDSYLFSHGTHYDLYRKLGAQPGEENGEKGTHFAVWAPHAKSVFVAGTFNGWDPYRSPMEMTGACGVYETFVPGAAPGDLYKFYIVGANGEGFYKSDPFARSAELRPGTASRICDTDRIVWHDGEWMKRRASFDPDKDPMAVYECHIGSWKRHPVETEGIEGFYTYREFADAVCDYCLETGYTHIELIGVAEHPFDGSWGYQVTGYFAPTSRYGTPEDFAYMIDRLHRAGIGVILDWVPAHFPKDASGLADFDGQPLYEYADPRKGEHKEWGTKVFDYSDPMVRNFLIASALQWIEYYHVDGLRVDAVASMLYLDYGRKDGEWCPNEYGGRENLDAVEFCRHLNSLIRGRNPGVQMIAEESTAWPQVTGRPEDGALGFSLKWNMGWMNDFLEYMKLDPYFRKDNHHKMTFSTSYCFSENYILVLSHDEVVHLKCSMFEKMPGLEGDKYANLRAGYTFMFGHPGKKLLFMGQDFGQRHEWDEKEELEWYRLAEPANRGLHDHVRALLGIYRKHPALYATDHDWRGFEWINADDAYRSIYSFVRKDPESGEGLLFVINFTPMAHTSYRVGCPCGGKYTLLLGTGGPGNAPLIGTETGLPDVPGEMKFPVLEAKKSECDGREWSIGFPLPAYGAYIFSFKEKKHR